MNPNIKEGTPDWDVFLAAIAVAVEPPLDPKTGGTIVRTDTIQNLRRVLDAAGIDWKTVKEARER